jgi:hypothetical protein
MSKFPILHFEDFEALEKFTNALGAKEEGSYKLGEVGIDNPLIKDKIMHIFYTSSSNISFGCLTQLDFLNDMCESSGFYNQQFEYYNLNYYDLLLSIRPDVPYSNDHSPLCRIAKDTLDILNYLHIDLKDILYLDDFKFASTPLALLEETTGMPVRFFLDFIERELVTGRVRNNNNNNDDDDYGVLEPKQKQIKKVDIDQSWLKDLKPIEDLEKISELNENLACIGCYEFKKSITMSCGHLDYCDLCFKKMMESTTLKKECPTCKKDFTFIVRTYI